MFNLEMLNALMSFLLTYAVRDVEIHRIPAGYVVVDDGKKYYFTINGNNFTCATCRYSKLHRWTSDISDLQKCLKSFCSVSFNIIETAEVFDEEVGLGFYNTVEDQYRDFRIDISNLIDDSFGNFIPHPKTNAIENIVNDDLPF